MFQTTKKIRFVHDFSWSLGKPMVLFDNSFKAIIQTGYTFKMHTLFT